jgi:ATP-binding cassette, subfamily F, member 3
MAFVQFTDVSLAFGARDILSGASLYLAAGTRAALAGPNGAGKSTLMKIAAGLMVPDSGERAATRGARISYLPQTGVVVGAETVHAEAEQAFSYAADLTRRQDEIGRMLEDRTLDPRATERLVEEHHRLGEALEASEYHRREERIDQVLRGLGFGEGDFGRPAGQLSGGWQMRVALAKILLENPDVMLLDEPTNYLDLEARTWLQSFLSSYAGAVLVVSHDRYFLDVTVREVYELFGGRLTRYPGTYSQYEERRSKELDAIFETWERQQEEIRRLDDFIRRFRYKASKAAQVQSRVKMLEKIVPVEIPEGMKRIHFSFPPAPRSGKITVRIEGLEKTYGDRRIIDDFRIEIERGTKMAFAGPNGAGKSTLMRLIAGVDTEYRGSIAFGSGVQAAYFAQDTAETMEGSHSVEKELESVCPDELLPKVRTMLGAFLFRGDDIDKQISVLSGGERSRLALLKMLLHPANLLILDEPTNHLDLTSKDILLEALKSFEGTVLFVSHDRGFIDELADRVLELESGRSPRLFVGGYEYYLEKKAALDATDGDEGVSSRTAQAGQGIRSAEAPRGIQAPKTGTSPPPGETPARGASVPGAAPAADDVRAGRKSQEAFAAGTRAARDEDKARKTRLRKTERREREILERLEAIAQERSRTEREMALPGNYSNGLAMKRLADAVARLDAEAAALNDEWLLVAEELAEPDRSGES